MPLRPSTSEIEHTRAFLRKWALGRFLAAEKSLAPASSLILILDAQDTVRDALAALARKHVLSAPVLDIRRALFLGFCGVRDIVAAFMRTRSRELLVVRAQIGHEPGAPGDDELQSASGMPHIDFAERKLETFMPGTDGHLLYNANDPGYNALSLLDVVEGSFLHAGAPGWPTCHRIAVCSNISGVLAINTIVSQTDIVVFLLQHAACGALGPLGGRSLEDLGLVIDPDTLQPRGVFCVDGDTPALDAFGALLARGLSAAGVVRSAHDATLVANLSISDLRAVLPDRFGVLALPVHRFLELNVAGGLGASRAASSPRSAVSVKRDATLEAAMRAIVAHRLHHVFVVDDAGVPLAVVSTTDVLRLLVGVV